MCPQHPGFLSEDQQHRALAKRAWLTVTQMGQPRAPHGGHLAWETGVFGGAGAEGKALAKSWSETSCTATLAPWGLGLPRGRPRPQTHGAGPLGGVSRGCPAPRASAPQSPQSAAEHRDAHGSRDPSP